LGGPAQADGDAPIVAAYASHWDACVDLARHFVRDRAIAEDVVQDVFFDLWLTPERYESNRSSLRTFLLVKTRGRAIDILRSETARREREARGLAPQDAPDAVSRVDTREDLGRALHQLVEPVRQAIELAYFGELSYRDVAFALCEAEGTIKSRIRLGLAHMRRDVEAVA
jgi:RNA polymerase sigma-70 factor (ECF subfamily)